jgi:hypothetical protein
MDPRLQRYKSSTTGAGSVVATTAGAEVAPYWAEEIMAPEYDGLPFLILHVTPAM